MVAIRDFRESDSATVRDMMNRLAKQRKDSTHDLVLKAQYERFFGAYMLGFLNNPDAVVKVAEDNGKIVGYAIATRAREPQFYKYSQTARLTDVFVQDDFRGHGIASDLLGAIEEWARKAKLHAIEVDVFPDHLQEIEALKGLGFFQYRVKYLRPLESSAGTR